MRCVRGTASSRGFTAVELIVSLGVASALIIGFFVVLNRFYSTQRQEIVKISSSGKYREIVDKIGQDIATAFPLRDSSGAVYNAIERRFPTTFTASSFDGIVLHKELHGELAGQVQVEQVSNN